MGKKINLDLYDWSSIQKEYNENYYPLGELLEKYNVTITVYKNAVKMGFFIKNEDPYWGRKNKKNKQKRSDNNRRVITQAHAEGRHPGWSVNSDPNKMSYPEKYFKSVINNEEYFKDFNIQYGLPFKRYFLDYALIDYKIDIEIDGEFHYRDKENIAHDKKRDDVLNENGWSVFRIPWIELKKDAQKIVKELINFIEKNENKVNKVNNRIFNIEEVLIKKNVYVPVYGTIQDYGKAISLKNKIIRDVKIDLLLNSDIDFSKYGWGKKASNLIEISNIHRFMKEHMLEFYDNNCFKTSRSNRKNL